MLPPPPHYGTTCLCFYREKTSHRFPPLRYVPSFFSQEDFTSFCPRRLAYNCVNPTPGLTLPLTLKPQTLTRLGGSRSAEAVAGPRSVCWWAFSRKKMKLGAERPTSANTTCRRFFFRRVLHLGRVTCYLAELSHPNPAYKTLSLKRPTAQFFFLFSVHPIYYLRTFSSSSSLTRRDTDPGSLKQALLPRPQYGTCLRFYRERS